MYTILIISLILGSISLILGILTAIQNIRNLWGASDLWKSSPETNQEPACKHRIPEGHVPTEEERAMIREGKCTGGTTIL